MYSCSVPLTLLWFLLSRSRITTVLTVLHQVMIYTIKRCDPGPPLITRRKLLLLMLHDRYIDRGPFIIFSDSLTVYRSIPWKGFHISIISVLLLLPLMTSGQYSNHSVLLGESVQQRKKKCVQEGMAGWCSGGDEGGVLTVGMMTPLKWRCQCAVSGGNSFQSLTVRVKNVLFLQSVWQQKHWYCRPWLLLLPFLLFQAKAPHTCLHGEFHTSTEHDEISWVASMTVYLLLEFTTTTTLPEMYPVKIL